MTKKVRSGKVWNVRERGRYNKRDENIVETSGNSAQTVQKRKLRVDATSVGNRERNRKEWGRNRERI